MHNDLPLNNPIVEFKNVYKKYGTDTVQVSDVSFSISKNQFVCLVGPSGCGKSTLLKMLAGIELPTSGTIVCDRPLSMVFQSGALLPWLSAYDNVALALEAIGVASHEIPARVKKYLALMKLENHTHSRPASLSGGQRQRVGIARALVVEPEILLLDEPFSALDEKTVSELHADLLDICRAMHITVLMITHQVEEAVTLADRVLCMNNGKIIEEISIAISQPRRAHELQFIQKIHEIRTQLFGVS